MNELTRRQQKIVDLLWDTLKKSSEHPDRVNLPTGTKTKIGLAKTVERIFNSRTTVVLRSDVWGEDETYAICAVEIDTSIITVEEFGKQAKAIMDEVRTIPEYDDQDVIYALENAGFTVVNAPSEITVRT